MLRKRARSQQKDQQMENLRVPDTTSIITSESSNVHSDSLSQKHKSNAYFTVPGLYVGLNPRNAESDSVISPTSPLDFRIFSSFGNPLRCLKLGCQKSWDCGKVGKVGLGIVDSLEVQTEQSGNVIRACDCKAIVLEQAPKLQPKDVVGLTNSGTRAVNILSGNGEAPFGPESGENFRACSLDSMGCRGRPTDFGSRKSRLGSGNLVPENSTKPLEPKFLGGSLKLANLVDGNFCLVPPSASFFVDAATESEADLSEYYTCVTTHGPNPKVTHIFGDRVLEGPKDEVTCLPNDESYETAIPLETTAADVLDNFCTSDFLKFCYSCWKNLEGEDIYMYSEKAFCSPICRQGEIDADEAMEKANKDRPKISDKPSNSQEISKSILFIGTP